MSVPVTCPVMRLVCVNVHNFVGAAYMRALLFNSKHINTNKSNQALTTSGDMPGMVSTVESFLRTSWETWETWETWVSLGAREWQARLRDVSACDT